MSTKPNKLLSLTGDVDESVQPSAPPSMIGKPKVSVALRPQAYLQLADWCAAAMRVRGKRVTHVEVYRALTDELFADPELGKRVLARLAQEGKKK